MSKIERRAGRPGAPRLAAAALALLALAAHPGAVARVIWGPPPAAAADCQGNACAQVAVTFDEARQQYRVQNNADRAVVVEGENLVAVARVRVGAGRAEYLPLKSLVGAYRANYE